MARRAPLMVVLLPLGLTLAGCGSSGGPGTPGPGGPPAPGDVLTLGGLEIRTDSGAAPSTVTLPSPATSPIAFTVLHGAKIVRLAEIGYARIAFVSDRVPNSEIYVMNADGTHQTRVTANALIDGHPDWRADGRKLVVERRRGGNWDIFSINADGSGRTRLTTDPARDFEPDWSPDGARIAFTSARHGPNEIYVMNADGSGQKRLTNNSASDQLADWSPDGRKIVFRTDRDTNHEIYVMNPDGSGQANLTNDGASDMFPAWSPDGAQVAFCSDRDGNYEIYVMNADGSVPTRLTDNGGNDWSPAWSPDGNQIAFQTTRDGNWETYVMNADGTNVRNLTNHAATDHSPAWCPAPTVSRCLIGPVGWDGGGDPPFGDERPLALVGVTDQALVSAVTVTITPKHWPSIRVAALQETGSRLVGVKITATALRKVLEDVGRGLPPREWDVSATPSTTAALVFLSATTGRITSVIASTDSSLRTADRAEDIAAATIGGRVVLRGHFTAAFSAPDPQRNLLASEATEVVLDSRTGEVLSVAAGN